MAKFTADVPLNIRLPVHVEISGAAGATHRIPDSMAEEFEADYARSIAGFAWVSEDETSAISGFDPGDKIDRTDGTFVNIVGAAVTATALRTKGGPWYDVRAYGAVGDDATDDAAIIASVLTAAGAGATIFFPAGTYLISSTLAPAERQTLMGVGTGTVIRYTGTGAAIRLGHTSNIASGAFENIRVTGIQITGTSSAAVAGIHVVAAHAARLDHLRIEGFSHSAAYAILFDTSSASPYVAAINGSVMASLITSCYNGIGFKKNASDPGTDGANHNYVAGIRISAFTGYGVNVDAGEFITLSGCDISTNVASATNVRINDNVACLFGVRTDNSASAPNGGIGISITSAVSDALLFGCVIGDGPETRLQDLGAGTVVLRQGYTRIRHVLDEPLRAPVIGAEVYASANIAVNDSSNTRLLYTNVEYNSAEIGGTVSQPWSSTTNTNRITVPTGADGTWDLSVCIRFASTTAGGYREAFIRKNGSDVLARVRQAAISGAATDVVVACSRRLVAGDWIEVLVWQNSGGALNVERTGGTLQLAAYFRGS